MWRHFGLALVVVLLRQVHTYPNIFKSATFSFPGFRPHACGELDSESGYFKSALQSGNK